jgi:hypothetical protein
MKLTPFNPASSRCSARAGVPGAKTGSAFRRAAKHSYRESALLSGAPLPQRPPLCPGCRKKSPADEAGQALRGKVDAGYRVKRITIRRRASLSETKAMWGLPHSRPFPANSALLKFPEPSMGTAPAMVASIGEADLTTAAGTTDSEWLDRAKRGTPTRPAMRFAAVSMRSSRS